MAIKADKTDKVPANLVRAAIQASDDYNEACNRSTVGTYEEERYSRVVYAIMREMKKNPSNT